MAKTVELFPGKYWVVGMSQFQNVEKLLNASYKLLKGAIR